MKTLQFKMILTCFLFIVSCKHEDEIQILKKDLENTTWIYEVYDDPICIDSIIFLQDNKGRFFHCEQEIDFDIVYEISNNTLIINQFEYVSEVDISKGQKIKSKFYFKFYKHGLEFKRIEQLVGGSFHEIQNVENLPHKYKKMD